VEALAEFEKAYALAPTPHARAQIALAQMAIGQFANAEASLTLALQSTGDKWITKHRDLLEKTLENLGDKLGTIDVSGRPVGAAVEIDGQDVCQLPCSQRVPSGEVALRVKARGYLDILRKISVPARSVAKEQFALVKPSLQPEAVAEAGTRPKPSPTGEPDQGKGLRLAGPIAVAVGVASLGVGSYWGWRAHTTGQELSSAPMFDASKERSGMTAETMQYVFLAGGAALIAGGGLLYWIGANRDDHNRDTRAQLLPLATPTGYGLAFSTVWR
jgi:hypothetical protein